MSDSILTGQLYLCGTPIGNLEDMTFRAIRILNECDFIACEDTRQTIKLLNHFEIKTKMISYHKHNEEKSALFFIEQLKNGKNIALVSDAGMPVISDPGSILIKYALENDIKIIPIPGPSAFLLALVASGFDINNFSYYGFLPHKQKDKSQLWELIKKNKTVSVLYESPHRLISTLDEILIALGDINICVCRELTKKYEEFFRGSVKESINYFNEKNIRGEFCIVIDSFKEEISFTDISLDNEIDNLINLGLSKKEISKVLSKKFNINSKEIYNILINKN